MSKKSGFDRYPLDERVLEALPKIGFHKPTAVQDRVIPMLLNRKNVIVEAATGTGKTAAYGLPLLSRIDFLKRTTQILVLVPSRELARQVVAALKTFTSHEKFRIEGIYGGMSLEESEKKVKSSPHVLVAVPGRFKDVLRTGKHDYVWRNIKYLVIDEADKLLEFGFQDILDKLVSNVRNMVQVALFSATISKDVEALIRERFYPIKAVRLSPQEALKNIKFHYIYVDKGQKERYLGGLIKEKNIQQALIFCSKREEVIAVGNFLRSLGRRAQAYHGLLDQVERAAIMGRFKDKQIEFLVATDLAARGLDVERLPAVINYSFPDSVEVYLHRCGRTGRAGIRGKVFNLVGSRMQEITVQSFHEEFQIGLLQFAVKPVRKNDIKIADDPMLKVHLNRGKRDKVRAGDIVGFLVNTTGVDASAIGTIAVYEGYAIVDIPESSFHVLGMVERPQVKGKSVKVTRYTLADQERKSEAVKKKQYGVRDKKQIKETAAKRSGKPKREQSKKKTKK